MLEFVAKSVPVADATTEIKSTSKMSCEKFMLTSFQQKIGFFDVFGQNTKKIFYDFLIFC